MKEDNYIDQEVQDMLDILTEHGRIARRQQQLSAMIDRSTALKRRRRWLWAIAAVVTLSVAVALSLNSNKNQSESMVLTMNEPNREMPQVADEPMAMLPKDEIVTREGPVDGTQHIVDSKYNHVKSSAFAETVEKEGQRPSFDEPLLTEPTPKSEIIESEDFDFAAGVVENPSDESFESQGIEPVSSEINHTVTNKKTDSVAPIIKRENPYRPKNKFTLRVGGEIARNSWRNFPYPPISPHFALGLAFDYHFTEYFSMGLGAEWFGVSKYHGSYHDYLHAIPVYADLKLNFWGKKNYSPFLEAQLGYLIPLNKVTEFYPTNGDGFYVDYILSGPYLSLGLGCSMKRSNLSAGVVYSHVIQPGKLKESFGFDIKNLINWGTNFYIRYDYTFSPFSDEGKSRLRQIKNGRLNEFIVDGFQLQLNVAGGFRPWCYSAGAVLEYKFPKRFSVGIGADFRGVNFTSREWGSAGYFENISEGQLLSVPVYGDLKVHFWENKPFSPFVEYRLGYAFALNSLTATHYDSYMYGLIYYETRHQGWYSYLGIGVTYNHSSLSLGILGQNGHHKETMWGNTNDLSGGYMGGHPFELRYSYKIGPLTKRHGGVK